VRDRFCPPIRHGEISLIIWCMRLPPRRPPSTTANLWTASFHRGCGPLPTSTCACESAPITMELTRMRFERGGIFPRVRHRDLRCHAASELELRSDVGGWPNLDTGRFRA
jgi:hypothetical protein